jgi:hypothetical protein
LRFAGDAPAHGSAGEQPAWEPAVNVDLTQSDRLFTGEGAYGLNSNCLACHSAGVVLNQPTLAKAAWQAEVNKMIQSYKAPIAPADVTARLSGSRKGCRQLSPDTLLLRSLCLPRRRSCSGRNRFRIALPPSARCPSLSLG